MLEKDGVGQRSGTRPLPVLPVSQNQRKVRSSSVSRNASPPGGTPTGSGPVAPADAAGWCDEHAVAPDDTPRTTQAANTRRRRDDGRRSTEVPVEERWDPAGGRRVIRAPPGARPDPRHPAGGREGGGG